MYTLFINICLTSEFLRKFDFGLNYDLETSSAIFCVSNLIVFLRIIKQFFFLLFTLKEIVTDMHENILDDEFLLLYWNYYRCF